MLAHTHTYTVTVIHVLNGEKFFSWILNLFLDPIVMMMMMKFIQFHSSIVLYFMNWIFFLLFVHVMYFLFCFMYVCKICFVQKKNECMFNFFCSSFFSVCFIPLSYFAYLVVAFKMNIAIDRQLAFFFP